MRRVSLRTDEFVWTYEFKEIVIKYHIIFVIDGGLPRLEAVVITPTSARIWYLTSAKSQYFGFWCSKEANAPTNMNSIKKYVHILSENLAICRANINVVFVSTNKNTGIKYLTLFLHFIQSLTTSLTVGYCVGSDERFLYIKWTLHSRHRYQWETKPIYVSRSPPTE